MDKEKENKSFDMSKIGLKSARLTQYIRYSELAGNNKEAAVKDEFKDRNLVMPLSSGVKVTPYLK